MRKSNPPLQFPLLLLLLICLWTQFKFVSAQEQVTCTINFSCVTDYPSHCVNGVCEPYSCFSILSNSSDVCNGNGFCAGQDTCLCYNEFIGTQCEQMLTCYGVNATDPTVCSGNGICTPYGSCACFSKFYGDTCEQVRECNGVLATNSSICSGNGYCDEEGCKCYSYATGSNCEIPVCNEKPSNDPTVCSGYGQCTQGGVCVCNQGRTGADCGLEIFNCYGYAGDDPLACSGAGECIQDNLCRCYQGYTGAFCHQAFRGDPSVECESDANCTAEVAVNSEIFTCFGISSDDPTVCSGMGSCTMNDTCSCSYAYYGPQCALYMPGYFDASADGQSMHMDMMIAGTVQDMSLDCNSLFKSGTEEDGYLVFTQFSSCKLQNNRVYYGHVVSLVVTFGNQTMTPAYTIWANLGYLFHKIGIQQAEESFLYPLVISYGYLLYPQALIVAPAVVGSCSDLKIDGSFSSNPDGQGIFTWQITNASNAFMKVFQNQSDRAVLTFESSLLEPGSTITVDLQIESKWRQLSSYTLSITKSSKPFPTVTLPSYSISTSRSKEVILEPSVLIPSCMTREDAKKITYSWEQTSGQELLNTLDLKSKVLVIPKDTFPSMDVYTFVLTVSIDNSSVSATAMIKILPQDLSAVIYGTNIQSVQREISFYGYGFDPDYLWYDYDEYTWELIPKGVSANILDDSVKADSYSLVIPANTVPAGNYTLKFTFLKGSRNATTTMNVELSDQLRPLVSIAQPDVPESGFNPSNYLALFVDTAFSFVDENLFFEWSSNDIDLQQPGVVWEDSVYASYIYVNPGMLTPGKQYTFRVTASDSTGPAYAEVTISVNKRPSGGSCTIEPQQGDIYTPFTWSCTNWQDEDTPLYYYLYYYDPSQDLGDEYNNGFVFFDWSYSGSSTVSFPAGSGPNGELELYFYVYDSNSIPAEQPIHQTILVTSPTFDNIDELESFGDEALEKLEEYWDMGEDSSATALLLSTVQLLTGFEGTSNKIQEVTETLLTKVVSSITSSSMSTNQARQNALVLEKLANSTNNLEGAVNALNTLAQVQDTTTCTSVIKIADTVGSKVQDEALVDTVTQSTETAANNLAASQSPGGADKTIQLTNTGITISSQLSNSLQASGKTIAGSVPIEIPATAFDNTIQRRSSNYQRAANQPSKVSFTAVTYNKNPFAAKDGSQVASQVVSLTIKSGNITTTSLKAPMSLKFAPLSGTFNLQSNSYSCNMWDSSRSKWDNSGCTKDSASSSQIVCKCDQVGAFAIVASLAQDSATVGNETTTVIDNSVVAKAVGLSIGLGVPFCLVIVIVAYNVFCAVVCSRICKKRKQQGRVSPLPNPN